MIGGKLMQQASPKSGKPSAIIAEVAQRLNAAFKSQFHKPLTPGGPKPLRRFSAREASEFLGVSEDLLKQLHSDGTVPPPEMVRGVWRYYTAEEMAEARRVLTRTQHGTAWQPPGRKDGDALQVWQVMNLKGGTGKSTTTIHLAHFFALRGYRVLLVDLDPQGSVTSMCGASPETERDDPTIYDAIRYEAPLRMADVLRPTHIPGLALAPASLLLSEFEAESAVRSSHDTPFFTRVRDAILQVEGDFDLVFIDSPPQFGFLTIAGMAAATSFIVPVTASIMDISSTAQFLKLACSYIGIIENAGASLHCENFRFLITRHDPADTPSRHLESFLRDNFPDFVMSATSLKSTVISNALISEQSIYEVVRSETTRSSYDRARASMDGVGREVEQMVRSGWRRR